MKRILTLICSLCSVAAMAQSPSEYNLAGKMFPQVNPDRTVTFQFNAPSASKVVLNLGKDYEMTKNDKGVWTVTTDPQVVGFHYYAVKVGGLSVIDPAGAVFYGTSKYSSAIEVPEDAECCSCENFCENDEGEFCGLSGEPVCCYDKACVSWRGSVL